MNNLFDLSSFYYRLESVIIPKTGILFTSIIVILLLYLIVYLLKSHMNSSFREMKSLENTLRNEIRSSVQSKFMDISVSVKDITELAVSIWRLEKKYMDISDSLQDTQKSGLDNSISRLKRYLVTNDIDVVDFTGQKYNEGLNIDILASEDDLSVDEPIIKETVEPTVMCRGQIIKKAKVILANNLSKG